MQEMRPRPSWPVVWILATRPHTLPLSISPVIAGSILGWAETASLRLDITLAALVSAVAIQIGTNLHNDAADSRNGTDRADRKGPLRVVQAGWVSAATVERGAHVAFVLALLAGLYLIAQGGVPIFLVGLASLLAGYAYSAGPWPISRGPWGEVFVTLFFGLIAVGGMDYLYSGTVSVAAGLLGLAIGLTAAAVLLVNNTRDRDGDAVAGRRTLAILLHRPAINRFYTALMIGAFVSALALPLTNPGLIGALAGLACLPVLRSTLRTFLDARAPETFNGCLRLTARFQILLVAAVGLGLIVTRAFF
ncbi:1,4-dihydroxy-2-naphthoate octaprenyltransferase [Pararhodospirillum oryzae]|uniref:1,4-dihydroxy-2-naphthoate octaprenyltransferase n=1 Tax=Pararhodospirillum oryzae TaxID=478448 RepID=A0A512HC55_9PROT|nr:1,4-dihydroxy-2-naphthoate octaprenyltransferase [Pararhodospirillum oryzae]GEO83029.1 1,4-dihydroxy-2-naphthoate octaprenyltransferase [Pararhodospirillum oryzae]